MPRDWETIRQEAKRERERLGSREVSVPIKQTRDRFKRVDKFLQQRLEVIRTFAQSLEGDSGDESDPWENYLFSDLDRIRRAWESAHSSDIPIEIYYYLSDIQDDFGTDDATYIVGTGLDVRVDQLHEELEGEERVQAQPNGNSTTQSDLSAAAYDPPSDAPDRVRIIRLPRNELQNPLSYALLVHELLHHSDVLDTLEPKLGGHAKSVPEEMRTEVCIDIISTVYLGPAYIPALIGLSDKVKQSDGRAHPSVNTRASYLYEHLELLEEQVGDRPLYSNMIEKARDEIQFKRSDGEFEVPDYGEFVELVREELGERDIPYFVEKYDDLFQLHGLNSDSQTGIHHGDTVTGTGDSRLVQRRRQQQDNVRTLLGIDGDDGSGGDSPDPVAVAIKPLLLFNLLLLLDEQRDDQVETVVMSSFRKWYARDLVS